MPKELDIVIIEDVPRDAEAMELALREEPLAFRSRRIETRDQLLRVLRDSPPDVVLSDFTLPEFNALEALSVLRSFRPDIPFILVTGNRSEEVAVACIKEGADDYILKASLRRLPSSILNALRKKEAERQKAAYEKKLRQLPRLILQTQESERRRVARELHDSVSQMLSSVKFRIQSVRARLPKDEDDALLAEVEKTRELLDRAISEVRRISRNLRPSELDDLGLLPALRSLCAEVDQRTGMHVELSCSEAEVELSDHTELSIYRIAQEALMNVEKHARAREVKVYITLDEEWLHLRVRDDGKGFESPGAHTPAHGEGGMGLLDIEERARMVGGVCLIDSSPSNGTSVEVRFPLGAWPEDGSLELVNPMTVER